jgi:phage-related protein
MAKAGNIVEGDALPSSDAPFRVRPLKQARKERLFQTEREALWVISQLKLLRHWPLDARRQAQVALDFDFSKVHHANETFYELRLNDQRLHQRNLRVFFWVDDSHRTIWIVHGYWKKTNRLDDAVKILVVRRIKGLKGAIQDGSAR